MGFPVLSDNQETVLTTIGGGVLGWIGSWLLEWYKKRKNPKEVEDSVMKNANDAANETIMTSQKVIEMLDTRLEKEKIYYNLLIERSKKECEEKISSMKERYDAIIEDLQAKIIKGDGEIQVLMGEKNTLQEEVLELQNQLKRYENANNIVPTVATTTTTTSKGE